MEHVDISPALLGNLLVSPGNALLIALVALIGYTVSHVLYNVYFHPLRAYPGPWFMCASRIPYCVSLMSGRLPFDVLELHKQYGDVVRIAPDELVFADARAWKDIMGHRGSHEPEFEKPRRMTRVVKDQPTTIINADRQEHGRIRKQMASGFSDRSLREQQPIITKYVDLLIRRLYDNCEDGSRSLDLVKWYNYTTFDVIGDLAFGEAFGCLETSQYHPWVSMIFQSFKLGTWLQTASFFPWFKLAIFATIPKGLREKREEHMRLTKKKLSRRMELGAERPDFIESLLRTKDGLEMDLTQLQANSSVLIVAGSETTATLLSGVTYLLATNADALAKLTEEVRATFKNEGDIDYLSVSSLPYMLACLDEALRLYPPAPLGIPRVVPEGGGHVAGHSVAKGTLVSVFHYAVYHSDKFFALPDEYHPERWLGDPRFANDDRDIFQPFHVGPRNCIGRNLAYIEMRLILARVLWNFDMKLADDSKNWIGDQKIYFLWEKGPLNVYLTPRRKD